MKSEKLEVVRGSGNVFRDLGRKARMPSNSRRSSPPKSSRRSVGKACACAPRTHARDRGGRLLAHPQREPRAVYRRSPHVDHQPARGTGGGKCPLAACGNRRARGDGVRAQQSMRRPLESLGTDPTRHSAEITRSGMESLLATPPSSAPTRNQTVSAAAHFRGSAVIRPSGLLSSQAQAHSLACRLSRSGPRNR